jgi:2-polyprenyl-3-methyl-5-hydroxy-6-metoxy-1,4-benzoquinol methylase
MDTTCVICGKTVTEKRFTMPEHLHGNYALHYCTSCNTGLTIPAPSEEELSKLYGSGNYRVGSGKRFNPVIELAILFFRKQRVNRIIKFIKRGAILDIGCGRGLFLRLMKRSGWNTLGIEYDASSAALVQESMGVEVVSGELKNQGFANAVFDVIVMNHSLEHMKNPTEVVQECARTLKPNGLLVIAVPNINSLQARWGGKHWFHLDIPYHLIHFSEKSLTSLLQRHNLTIKHIRRFDLEYNPYGWLQTLLNLSGISKNMLYDLLKDAKLRKSALKHFWKKDIILTCLLTPTYVLPSMILFILECILGRSGTIEIYAQKISRLPH